MGSDALFQFIKEAGTETIEDFLHIAFLIDQKSSRDRLYIIPDLDETGWSGR